MQMLSSVWDETDYHSDVCKITSRAHVQIRWQSKLLHFLFMLYKFHCCSWLTFLGIHV